jgi:hypothetical protein
MSVDPNLPRDLADWLIERSNGDPAAALSATIQVVAELINVADTPPRTRALAIEWARQVDAAAQHADRWKTAQLSKQFDSMLHYLRQCNCDLVLLDFAKGR